MNRRKLRPSLQRTYRGAVGLSAALAMFATALPVVPAQAAQPGSIGNPTPAVEMTGDELGLGPNTCKKWPAGKRFTITIPREAELEQLVQWMMTISCQKFIWNAKIRSGKVTILSPEQVTLREAYAAFYAALENMGLTVEPAGDYFKIVESSDSKSLNVPMYDNGSAVPNNDRFVTQLLRVEGGNADQLLPVLKKLKSKQGNVEAVGDLLIITDRGASVRRLVRIVNELDTVSSGEKIFFYQLQYADADEVADIVREIFGETGTARRGKKSRSKKSSTGTQPTASFSRVIVDDRTGTLIIVSKPSDYSTILRLIQQLDVRLPGGGGRIHVKKLRNADPKEVAKVLQNLAKGTRKSSKNASGNKSASEGGVATELFSGDIKVTADEDTRSLVIMASAADYKNLEMVIDELDVARKQVYLEMYLMETVVDRTIEGGAGGHVGFPVNNVDFGGTQGTGVGLISSAPSPDVSTLAISPTALQGLAGGVLGPLIPGSGQLLGTGTDVPSFGVLIQAIQRNNDVNVLAQPHIYTADNQKAELEVGRRVPTPGQLSFGGGQQGFSTSPLQSVRREDVTLKIEITPHINDEETVSLDVEVQDRDIASTDPVLGVTTTQRKFKLESVLGRDDQPLVLGGLIRERERENTQQVPGLGSIPLLGWLFKRKAKTREKVNLLVIMVPHIVETPDDIRRIHERRMEERREFIERYTAFKHRDLDAAVDYRTKEGLLASVDREARRMEAEEMLLREAEAELAQERITGEIGASVSVAGGSMNDDDSGDEPRTTKTAKPTVTVKPEAN